MKSRQGSAQPEIIHQFRIDMMTKEPPHLQFEGLPPITMNGFSPFGTPNSISSPSLLTPNPTPVRTQNGDSLLTTMRNPSSNADSMAPISSSPALPENAKSPFTNGVSPQSRLENQKNSPWSSAVGHASTGKSGRVIERLMAEHDRLRRELAAEITNREELQKSLQTQKPQIEALRAENANLAQMRSIEVGLVERRDRKVAELKAELEVEKTRREAAEQRVLELARESEEAAEMAKRELQEARETERHASTHATILETSHKQLSKEYRQRTETVHKTLRQINEERQEDRQKLSKLDIVADAMRTELEKTRKINTEIVAMWENHKAESQRDLESLKEAAHLKDQNARKLSTEMEKVVGEMRWLMGVKHNVRDCNGVFEPSTGT
ncbi:mother-specific HO expression [Elasticomyces elasticus]|nr:mother-specific HO expression [Elasticomyces elasticus]KAK4997931.1 mother-specific HO expression [Elasticomyces elasticus]